MRAGRGGWEPALAEWWWWWWCSCFWSPQTLSYLSGPSPPMPHCLEGRTQALQIGCLGLCWQVLVYRDQARLIWEALPLNYLGCVQLSVTLPPAWCSPIHVLNCASCFFNPIPSLFHQHFIFRNAPASDPPRGHFTIVSCKFKKSIFFHLLGMYLIYSPPSVNLKLGERV